MVAKSPKQHQASAMLERAGLRPTRQRVAVIDALRSRPEALTAQDLHHELRGSPGAPGLATIYRTLTALTMSGDLDTFPRDGEQAFRLCGPDHHHHLVCRSCGSVEEVGADAVESWVRRVAKQRRFKVQGHTVDVYGLCAACT
jgi:Fur family ferric uptake transcriptional regulator